MDKSGLRRLLLFLFMIVFGRSNAFHSRKLVTTPDPNANSNANQDSPMSSPPPDEKKQNSSPVGAIEPKDTPMTNSSDVESKGLNDTNTMKTSENSSDKGKAQDGKENVRNQTQSKTFASESCKGNTICSDREKTIIACIQDLENGTNKTILVQNEGDMELKVNITFETFNNLPPFVLHGHETKMVNITLSEDKSTKVILNAGNGYCELQIGQPKTVESPAKPKNDDTPATSPKDVDSTAKSKDVSKSNDDVSGTSKSQDVDDVDTPVSENNFLDQLSLYSKQVTPIYGAYFAFLVALAIGGSWALCTFRKRRSDGGFAYRELEMGRPESSHADVETAEGWDADWDDDDWDGDKAIRSPGGSKTISSRKDGWDADWDD